MMALNWKNQQHGSQVWRYLTNLERFEVVETGLVDVLEASLHLCQICTSDFQHSDEVTYTSVAEDKIEDDELEGVELWHRQWKHKIGNISFDLP